jgi:hypothetical protein
VLPKQNFCFSLLYYLLLLLLLYYLLLLLLLFLLLPLLLLLFDLLLLLRPSLRQDATCSRERCCTKRSTRGYFLKRLKFPSTSV